MPPTERRRERGARAERGGARARAPPTSDCCKTWTTTFRHFASSRDETSRPHLYGLEQNYKPRGRGAARGGRRCSDVQMLDVKYGLNIHIARAVVPSSGSVSRATGVLYVQQRRSTRPAFDSLLLRFFWLTLCAARAQARSLGSGSLPRLSSAERSFSAAAHAAPGGAGAGGAPLAGGAVGGGAARLGRVVGDRADDDDVGLSARVECAIERERQLYNRLNSILYCLRHGARPW